MASFLSLSSSLYLAFAILLFFTFLTFPCALVRRRRAGNTRRGQWFCTLHVRVYQVNTKVSSQMLDDVTLHESRPAQLQGSNSAYSLSAEGNCSLLLLLQLLFSVPLSWKHFTNYKTTYEPGHACGFMWTAGRASPMKSVMKGVQMCAWPMQVEIQKENRNRDSVQMHCSHHIRETFVSRLTSPS